MKNYLPVLATMVIVVTALVFPLERDSFAFRDREDRDFRKITITSPEGGETFRAGSKQEISWQASRSIRYVKIEYSTDNGKKWIEIVKNMKMDETFASYNWQVPCTPTSKAKMRVSDVYGPDYDVIINSFSILCDSKTGKENQNRSTAGMKFRQRIQKALRLSQLKGQELSARPFAKK